MTGMFDKRIQLVIEKDKSREQLHTLGSLIAIGRDQGYITYDDILERYPNVEHNTLALEEVFAAMISAQIPVLDRAEREDINGKPDEEVEAEGVTPGPVSNENHNLEKDIDNLVGLYFSDAANIPLLSFEEEIALARTIEQGREASQRLSEGYPINPQEKKKTLARITAGNRARQRLILSNTRLVISIAKRHMGRGVPFLDLIQEGNIGLMRAMKKFDFRRGYKFSTYATWWIRQAITRIIANHSRTIRLPVHMNDRISKLFRVKHQLKQDLGREPRTEELAEALNFRPARVNKMLRYAKQPISLDMPINFERDRELGDVIEDKSSSSPEEDAAHTLAREGLEKILREKVSPREARVLRLRYGMPDGKMHTLQEIGQKMGVTRERVRQIEAQALRRLRRPRTQMQLRDYK